MEGFDISSNVYAITGDYITIIDPGNDYTAFMELFASGFKPTDIKKIVLTHGHFEHVMGAFELMGYPSLRESGGIEIIFHESGPVIFREKGSEYDFPLTFTEVTGGEILNLSGFELEVIHTPPATPWIVSASTMHQLEPFSPATRYSPMQCHPPIRPEEGR